MDILNLEGQLKHSLERTGVSEIHIFFGEFYKDLRLNKKPRITYVVDSTNLNKKEGIYKLEEEIREGLYKERHHHCYVRTSIEKISDIKDKHMISIRFEDILDSKEKTKRAMLMAVHLKKIINEYHFKK